MVDFMSFTVISAEMGLFGKTLMRGSAGIQQLLMAFTGL